MQRFEFGDLSLYVFGGWNEIGGNQILLSTKAGSLLLDFGKSFGRWKRYFTEFINPRSGFGVRDLLFLGLLPPVRGLYRDTSEDTLIATELDRLRLSKSDLDGERIAGLLLSHAHLDHTGAIAYLRNDLPIIATGTTAAIAKAMQDTGQTNLESEITYLNPRTLNDEGILSSKRNGYLRRPFKLIGGTLPTQFANRTPSKTKPLVGAPWEQFGGKLGSYTIEALPVDHSVPGAVAFCVGTESGSVVYTGDLRRHGRWSKNTEETVRKLALREITLLIVEGTRLGRSSKTYTEAQVKEALHALIRQHSDAPIIVDFAPRNLERMLSCVEIGREVGRKLVITPKDAHMLVGLSEAEPFWRTVLEEVVVLKEKKARRAAWEEQLWEEAVAQSITIEEIIRAPYAFLLAFSFFELNRLIDLRIAEEASGVPSREGIYIFSNSYWADDEQILDLEVLLNWLNVLGFKLHPPELAQRPRDASLVDNPYHTSGHAPQQDLVEIVRQIRPRAILPIHTEAAGLWHELLRGEPIEVLQPK